MAKQYYLEQNVDTGKIDLHGKYHTHINCPSNKGDIIFFECSFHLTVTSPKCDWCKQKDEESKPEAQPCMSRGIKFRGKRIDNGEWVYGALFSGEIMTTIFPQIVETESFNLYRMVGYEVLPSTVGQFAGFHDKNGKEIWEGDIWEKDGQRWVIAWADKYARFVPTQRHGWIASWCDSAAATGEIAGTVHDNPDLIER